MKDFVLLIRRISSGLISLEYSLLLDCHFLLQSQPSSCHYGYLHQLSRLIPCGTFSGIICYKHSALRLFGLSNRDSFLPYLRYILITVGSKKLTSCILLSPPGSNETKSQNTSNILARSFESTIESIDFFHLVRVVLLELLESYFVRIGD